MIRIERGLHSVTHDDITQYVASTRVHGTYHVVAFTATSQEQAIRIARQWINDVHTNGREEADKQLHRQNNTVEYVSSVALAHADVQRVIDRVTNQRKKNT